VDWPGLGDWPPPFERIHGDSYQRLGFDLVEVPAATVAERAAAIDAHIRSWT
jgi:predicted ATPase